jgi:hypothetical protein
MSAIDSFRKPNHKRAQHNQKKVVATMKETNWKVVAELIGIAAIVASLLFVGLQMHLDRQVAESQGFMDSAAISVDLTQVLAEHNDVWIRGLMGEQLDRYEEHIFHINSFCASE